MSHSKQEKPIGVLCVDDSPLIRKILTRMIGKHPDLKLLGTAHNGKTALEEIARKKPDVITLDFEMPEMDGLETLRRIMQEMPTPVIMLSSYSVEGADLTFRALDLGAVDFIAKPHKIFSRSIEDIETQILNKIRAASQVHVKKMDPVQIKSALNSQHLHKEHKKSIRIRACDYVISIGVSTGGPLALKQILPMIPADINACFLIVQHMPPGFTKALADRLNEIASVDIKEADDGDLLMSGKVYIAKGDHHLIVRGANHGWITGLSINGHVSSFRPSIDVLMNSTSKYFEDRNIGVIMTGMCADGVKGVQSIKNKNGRVIAQDERTSVIFGMNKLAIQAGYVDEIVPLNQIIPKILEHINYA
ncbi:chemotaxis response regulator protein-glutamate methylesterase [bacterium]|nr:chemotaxis response regulator protein-glutamate methylesterase [bacterium]